MRRRYVAFEVVFAICSAISPVQKRLDVHHAASGSAATNPEGTIKLHLNKAGSRDQGGKGEEGEARRGRNEGRRGWGTQRREKRSGLLHRYRKRLPGREWGSGRSRGGGDIPESGENVIALTTTAEKGGRFERSGLNK